MTQFEITKDYFTYLTDGLYSCDVCGSVVPRGRVVIHYEFLHLGTRSLVEGETT